MQINVTDFVCNISFELRMIEPLIVVEIILKQYFFFLS